MNQAQMERNDVGNWQLGRKLPVRSGRSLINDGSQGPPCVLFNVYK